MNNKFYEDYIIVEDNKNILLRFNDLIIEVFEYMKKKEYHRAKDTHNQLKILYNKLVINEKRKHALAILLNEIYNHIEFNILKYNTAKKIKEHKLRKIPYKFKIEIPKIKYQKLKKKPNKIDKKFRKIHRLIKEGKSEEAELLLK